MKGKGESFRAHTQLNTGTPNCHRAKGELSSKNPRSSSRAVNLVPHNNRILWRGKDGNRFHTSQATARPRTARPAGECGHHDGRRQSGYIRWEADHLADGDRTAGPAAAH